MASSLPTIGEKGVEDGTDCQAKQDIALVLACDDDDGHHDEAGIMPSSINQTPYQIFLRNRNNSTATKKQDMGGDCAETDEQEEAEESRGGISTAPRIDIDTPEETMMESGSSVDPDGDMDAPSTTSPRNRALSNDENSFPGFLSPNSVKIRQNALMLLERRPRKKYVDKSSRPLQPLSSLMNIQAPTTGPPSSLSKGSAQNKSSSSSAIGRNNIGRKILKDAELNILEELEADFEEEEMRTSLSVLRQTNNDATVNGWQKENIIREDKATELGKVQEELQRVQRDLGNMKRQQESLAQQNEDKENTICQLRKSLRLREQLNEKKIGHGRGHVTQSRIPAPTKRAGCLKDSTNQRRPLVKPTGFLKPSARTKGARSLKDSTNQQRSLAKPTGLVKPSARTKNGTKRKAIERSGADAANRNKKYQKTETGTAGKKKNEPNNVACIRSRIIEILQEHDPSKIGKVDIVMAKYERREAALLKKMIARYEGGGKKESKTPRNTASTAEATESTASSIRYGKPRTRQDMALERHMARMKKMKG